MACWYISIFSKQASSAAARVLDSSMTSGCLLGSYLGAKSGRDGTQTFLQRMFSNQSDKPGLGYTLALIRVFLFCLGEVGKLLMQFS